MSSVFGAPPSLSGAITMISSRFPDSGERDASSVSHLLDEHGSEERDDCQRAEDGCFDQ